MQPAAPAGRSGFARAVTWGIFVWGAHGGRPCERSTIAVALKPLHQQVIVITGASSRIGPTTARRRARPGDNHALYSAGNRGRGGTLRERGGYGGHVAETSVYTAASLLPWKTAAIISAAGVAVATLASAALARRGKDWLD